MRTFARFKPRQRSVPLASESAGHFNAVPGPKSIRWGINAGGSQVTTLAAFTIGGLASCRPSIEAFREVGSCGSHTAPDQCLRSLRSAPTTTTLQWYAIHLVLWCPHLIVYRQTRTRALETSSWFVPCLPPHQRQLHCPFKIPMIPLAGTLTK